MQNAKKEFLNTIENKTVLCATISYQNCWDRETPTAEYKLPISYTKEQYNSFVESLDFDYDNGFGGQELFGTIWYTDGTWADRGEYDGSEWWQNHVRPIVPEELRY
jgi:hypothetical protein